LRSGDFLTTVVPMTALPIRIVELIARKRDGGVLEDAEISAILHDFMQGGVTDYQMSALLMAIFFRGLNDSETVALTNAMLHSGSVLSLPNVKGFKADKHSTGGVGDKVSICLAPMVAAAGVAVPMVSGRGLGHTGGTLDKLEAIPGFRTDLDVAKFTETLEAIGTCMIGQTKDIAPADKRIYALRDVTATVECVPLIVASILSKKLAEGIDGLVLDVKVGRGAFMKTEASARVLAEALVRVGTQAGKKVTAVLTRMDTPLGLTIGNANETREALEILHGKGPSDLLDCTLILGGHMLHMAGKVRSLDEGKDKLRSVIADRSALGVMSKMVHAQGGDARVVEDPSLLKDAPQTALVNAPVSGFMQTMDALEFGLTAVSMGAGRARADQSVDPLVGIELIKKPGDAVKVGEPCVRMHLQTNQAPEAFTQRLAAAMTFGPSKPSPNALVVETLSGS
jgi:pyrimidine-nucleoside phosphorylase